jgi:hypothetical protein
MKNKAAEDKPIECDCKNWASDGRLPLLSHHHRCKNYNPIKELMKIISDLLVGIEEWGAEEDGIACFDAYKRAKVAMGQFNFKDD